MLGVSVVGSSLLNPLIPTVSRASITGTLLFQSIIGLVQSLAFPSCYWMYPRWMPVVERTIMVAFVVSGVFLVRSFLRVTNLK